MDSQWTAREISKLVLKRKFLVAGITLATFFQQTRSDPR